MKLPAFALPLCLTATLGAQSQQPLPQPPPASPAAPAQTPAPSTTHPDFSGTWAIDRSLSNDPTQANFGATQQGQTNQGSTQRRGGGGFGGFGGGGFGRGGGGGSRSRSGSNANNADGLTQDERDRLTALTAQVKQNLATLVISHHDPSFVVTDTQERALFFHTTNEREDVRLGEITMPSTTRWDADRIVSELDVSSRRHLIYTYTLLPASKQLVLRIHMDNTSGSRGDPPELKLVYKQAAAAASSK
jgi:hypothetical protein